MAEAFLSQDEVDALLDGVQDAETPPDVPPSGTVQPCDLARRDSLARTPMPALESAHERFARNLAAGLASFVGRRPVVTANPARVRPYASFLQEIAVPAHFNLMQVKPLRGNALLVCEPELVSAMVDVLFGGDGRPHPVAGAREFPAAEQHIGRRIVEVACDAWRKAWAGTWPIELELIRSEAQPRFVAIAAPSDLVVSSRFDIEAGRCSGALHLGIPYSTLEPIRQTLHAEQHGEAPAPDQRWIARLSRQIESAEVELVAELGHARATVADLVALKAGDFIELELGQTVQATVDGVPVLSCRYGISNGRYAIKVQSFLTSQPDNPNGVPHGER